MFGFLTPGTKDAADPLVSAKSAAAWLRQQTEVDKARGKSVKYDRLDD